MKRRGYGDIKAHLSGMTAIAISKEDAVAPAKILKNYAEKVESFKLLAGFVDGEILDEAGIKALAEIPNKETLVCKIMGCMSILLFIPLRMFCKPSSTKVAKHPQRKLPQSNLHSKTKRNNIYSEVIENGY